MLYKLMNNAVYVKNNEKRKKQNGYKTCEQQKRRIKNGYPSQAMCHTKHLTMIQSRYVKAKLH